MKNAAPTNMERVREPEQERSCRSAKNVERVRQLESEANSLVPKNVERVRQLEKEANSPSPKNVERVRQLEKAWADVLVQTLRRGFFGNVEIEVNIQDGVIQHFRRIVEQVEK